MCHVICKILKMPKSSRGNTRLKAGATARKEQLLAKLIWLTDGKCFEYFCPQISLLKIQLTDMWGIVHNNLSRLH